MKCKLCNKEVQQTFLNKLIGSYVKDSKGKRHPVCQTCQKSKSMEDIKSELK